MAQDRYQKGWEKLKEIDGEAGEKVIESLKDICPDLGRYTIEFPFGDIYARPGLDLKSREIATVAALTARLCVAATKSSHSRSFECWLHA